MYKKGLGVEHSSPPFSHFVRAFVRSFVIACLAHCIVGSVHSASFFFFSVVCVVLAPTGPPPTAQLLMLLGLQFSQGVQNLMGCIDNSKIKKTLKKWFFIDKRVGGMAFGTECNPVFPDRSIAIAGSACLPYTPFGKDVDSGPHQNGVFPLKPASSNKDGTIDFSTCQNGYLNLKAASSNKDGAIGFGSCQNGFFSVRVASSNKDGAIDFGPNQNGFLSPKPRSNQNSFLYPKPIFSNMDGSVDFGLSQNGCFSLKATLCNEDGPNRFSQRPNGFLSPKAASSNKDEMGQKCLLDSKPASFNEDGASDFGPHQNGFCSSKLASSDKDGATDFGPCQNGFLSPNPASPNKVEDAGSTPAKDLSSALEKFDEMMTASKGKQIVVFLDYDGTLSPIVDDPNKAYMSKQMRSAVRNVAKNFPTAIISGRCRDKVYEFVRLTELYYAGSHGMDIMGPPKGGKTRRNKTTGKKINKGLLHQPASEFLPTMDEIYASLLEKTKKIDGAFVENNRFCVSVHYRHVQQESLDELEKMIDSEIAKYHGFRLTEGKMVKEIRPPLKWDKGKALEFILESLGLANCNDVLPLYIGDDRTDEDAFKVLEDRGQGYGILVSQTPKETSAKYFLKEPSEVMRFLKCLVEWKQGHKPKGVRSKV